MSEAEDRELEELKRRRYLELQKQLADQEQRAQAVEQQRVQKDAVMRQILSPVARQRLANLRIVRPEYVEQLEAELIRAVQTGKVQVPISDEQLRVILNRLIAPKRDIQIRRL